jgi:hypothetical protein
MPYQVTAKDGNFWRATIDGEQVTEPFTAGVYSNLVERIKAARAARAKARRKAAVKPAGVARSIIRQIVGRCHVSDSNRTVIRYFVSRLRKEYSTLRDMPRSQRREQLRAVIEEHAANRKLFQKVTSGTP